MSEIWQACTRCKSPLESGDLRCAVCAEVVPFDSEQRVGTKVVVKIYRCTGCGAAIRYDPDRRAPTCSFCDAEVKVETVEDPVEQTQGYLPFTISYAQATTAVLKWLKSQGWFRPSDLGAKSQLASIHPLWWVAWIFDCKAKVSWASDSDAGAKRSRWAPHSGKARMQFDDILISASRGLTNKEVERIVPGYNLRVIEPAQDLAFATVEEFDVQRSQARRQITDSIEAIAARRVAENHVPGQKTRNTHVSVLLEGLHTRRLSFPVWVMSYRYNKKTYRVVVCGQDARLLDGDAPYSWKKILAVGLGIVAATLALGAIAANL